MPLAARLSRAALADGGDFQAAEVLATVLFLTDRPGEALAVVDARSGSGRLRWLCLRGVVAYWGHFDVTAPDALADGRHARARVAEQSWTRALEALMRLHRGEPRAARQLAGEVLDEPASPPGPRAVARTAMAHLLAAGGAPARARAMVEPTGNPYLSLAAELAH